MLVVGNLKMNMETVKMREDYLNDFEKYKNEIPDNIDMVVCPQMLYVERFVNFFNSSNIRVGAQDSFWELYGSFTGQSSPKTISSLGAEYVILGHSERRVLGETDDYIVKKVDKALKVGLKPIICIGFSYGDYDEIESISRSVNVIMESINKDNCKNIIFAYEPVWAIGSGKVPTAEDIYTVVLLVKKIVGKYFSDCLEYVRILYGGSVSVDNILDITNGSHIDGVLVGGASLQAERFVQLAKVIGNLNLDK